VSPAPRRGLNGRTESSRESESVVPENSAKSITLRPLAGKDFESLYEIDQKCYPPQLAYSRREFRWYLRLPAAEGIVAESPGQIAGFILTACFERSGHIITIDVLPEFRRAHVGSALLRAAEESLARRGAKEIELETAVDNDAAIQFWTNSGYLKRGILKNYYPGGLAAYAMIKHLRA
jgi:[ribosomal protein S18]-alanine N-acetyltransferase